MNNVAFISRPARCKNTLGLQSGFTIVEMLIGLVLGLVVISAVINVYVGSSRSSRFSEGLRTMQENGRHGIMTLQRGVRLAGYSPGVTIAPFDFVAGNNTTLVVRMMQQIDCNGQSTAAAGGLAVNTYNWDQVARVITCTGGSAAATAMPLIEGVDGFRVLYGIDTDGDDLSESYVPYSTTLNPMEINSLRFSILVNSMSSIRNRAVAENHVLLDEPYASNDAVSRRVFTSTVLLRNRR